jgi:hypothetical protein
MIKEIRKCDFDPKDTSERFISGKSGKKIKIISDTQLRKVEEGIKLYLTVLCNQANIEESEIKYYDDETQKLNGPHDQLFRLYFRGFQFIFSYDYFDTVDLESIKSDFGKFLKMKGNEIDEFIEQRLIEERKRNKVRGGNGNSWRKPPPDDEDLCTGEYSWNID